MSTIHKTREAWLEAAVRNLAPLFAEKAGVSIPDVRVSVGFAGGGRNSQKTIGQCWHGKASSDGVAQIFVSPVLGDSIDALAVLTHEIVHSINFEDDKSGHGAAFAKIAKAVGLEGKMTATTPSGDLVAHLKGLLEVLGDYPHAALTPALSGVKKQGTRMLKVECGVSGYTLRTSAKWLDTYGAPICPCHGEVMDRV